jgi:hypothetical protein
MLDPQHLTILQAYTACYGAWVRKNLFSVLKVPRQCPLVLIVGVEHFIDRFTFYMQMIFTHTSLHGLLR